jgi:hypothetical protein
LAQQLINLWLDANFEYLINIAKDLPLSVYSLSGILTLYLVDEFAIQRLVFEFCPFAKTGFELVLAQII